MEPQPHSQALLPCTYVHIILCLCNISTYYWLLHARHSIINSICTENGARGTLDFYAGSIHLSFCTIAVCFTEYMMRRYFISECCSVSVQLCQGFALLVIFIFIGYFKKSDQMYMKSLMPPCCFDIFRSAMHHCN